jgi:hypothetical protein
MIDSMDLSINSPESSSVEHFCINEILIHNQSYIISMYLHNGQQSQIDLEVQAKESADQWKAIFDITGNN